MITTKWKIDDDRSADFLECKKESSRGLREFETDIVKVYFYSKYDVDTAKGLKLEPDIARAIFSNRSKYGSAIDAYLDVYPNTIHFRTATDVEIYNECWPVNFVGAE